MDDSFYRDIAETSVDGLWVLDLDGNTRYANPALAAMFGVPVEEFVRLTVFDTLDADGQVQFRAHLAELREGQVNDETVEVLFVRRDGSGLWTLVSEKLLRDADGRVLGVLHRVSDNDGRRRRMDELAESRRQLAEAHSIARLGGWSLDPATGAMHVSDHLREMYGLSHEEEHFTLAGWLEAVHPADRAVAHAHMTDALLSGTDLDFIVRVQGARDWIWTRARGVAHHDGAGRVSRFVGTLQDVTSHKRIEEALEHQLSRNALLQAVSVAANEARSLGDAVAGLREGVLARDAWRDLRAYVPTEDGLDVVPIDGESEPDLSGERAVAREAMDAGASTWDVSGMLLAHPLSYKEHVRAVIVLGATRPPADPAATAMSVGEAAAQLVRVIEREHAEQQLSAARDAALRASQAKSEFLAVMSHEIRTPLNGVIGLNELLLGSELGTKQRQLAHGVRDAGRSLLRLINDVLDLSKIEAGHLELERVDFDVRDVCDRAVGLMSDAARRKQIELAVACHPDVPEILAGDPTRFGQVIANLVSNAVKFTDEGQVLVQVTSRRLGRRVRLQVAVSDTGSGITPEAQERIFDDFSQADVSTTRVHGGTGLGLSISRRIAEALDGELTVTSTPGEGSTFSFTAVVETPHGSRTSPDDDLARARLTGGRILVVSDDVRRGDLLRDQLSLWRTRVDVVTGGDEASAAVALARDEEDVYEAVVVDVPATHPQEARDAARLIAQVDGLRVFLVLTQRPETVRWTESESDVLVLTKPVTSAALRDALLGVDADAPEVSATTAALVRTDRRRILVVEDNPVNQMVATGMLESLGYDVDLAEDGVECTERFDPDRHDAVLMDVQMPRMDGYAATRWVREHHAGGRRTPILAMTAAAIEGERQRCLDAGMDDFLTKPVDLNHLGSALGRWLPAPETRGLAGVQTTSPSEPEPRSARRALQSVEGPGPLDHERLEMLHEMDPGPDSYLLNAIDNFLANSAEAVAGIRRTVEADDTAAAVTAAHRLVGSALNLGLVRVGEAARAVELWDADGPGATVAAYAALVDVLEEAMDEATPALAAYAAARPRLASA